MSDLKQFKEDFAKTFGPSPEEIDWKTANAMKADNAMWGQRMQGALWAAKWMAEKTIFTLCEGCKQKLPLKHGVHLKPKHKGYEEFNAPNFQCSAVAIRQLAKELES